MMKFYNDTTGVTVVSTNKDFSSHGYVLVDDSDVKTVTVTEDFSLTETEEIVEETETDDDSSDGTLSDLMPSMAREDLLGEETKEIESFNEVPSYTSYREIQHNAEKEEGALASVGDQLYEFDGSRWKKAD